VLSVRKGDKTVMIADGQISLGPTVFKNTAKKLRRLSDDVVCGFAGSAADCLALMELLEKEFEKYPGQTLRSCLSLAKQWRTTKIHSQLSADLIVSDSQITVLVDGSGNCIEIEDGLVAIGSGGLYAQSAATGMMDNDLLTAEDVATKAMKIAADLCVYTNHTTCMEVLTKPVTQILSLGNPSPATQLLMKFLEVTYDQSTES
jgi:ATP-dependent HslUV protease, peptidase subunit HslV